MTFLLVRPAARSTGRRRFTTLLATASAAVVALTGLAAAPSAQASSSSTEQQFVSSINGARHSAGRPSLATSSDLTAVARAWAATMASSDTLQHNPRLTSQVRGWRFVGENVGMGGDVASLHQAFMASAPHKANILDRDYTQIGVGVASGHGRLWVVEVFRTPSASSSASRVLATKHVTKKTTKSVVYRTGSRGATVKKIQRVVGVRADGIYGPRTRAAVKRWQKRHHRKATGYVNAATRRAMRV
ncbi:MAG TPA: CAP domain-containing protein [Actinomycetales bacterium]|nr:CAP domain-containing protein [Actinomycetales bacterium]